MTVAVAELDPITRIQNPELSAGVEIFDPKIIPETRTREDCILGDVDDLARFRTADGYEPHAINSVKQNKVTAVQEGALPYARSHVKHEFQTSAEGGGGLIMDLGRTAVETAMRGMDWYRFEATKARGEIEIEHAVHNQENLREGVALVKISPKMTRKDGSLEVAKTDGVADADSLQVYKLGEDEKSAITECILVPDVPIQAWASMLEDSKNIFGKSIVVEDPESALAVMKAYEDMEVSVDELPEGPISVLVAVSEYIEDPIAKDKVTKHIDLFRAADQQELSEQALVPAERWLQFDMSIDQSLAFGLANRDIEQFIEDLQDRWGDEDRKVIQNHRFDNGYIMTRELAAILQNAERNIVLTATAVVAGNASVLKQITPEVAKAIYRNEIAIQNAHRAGFEISAFAGDNGRLIASQNVKVGGGCSGSNVANFKADGDPLAFDSITDQKDDGDCEFISKSCPECGTKNVKTIVTKTHISGSCGCSKTKS